MADEINNTPETQGLPEPKNFNDYLILIFEII